MNKVKASQHNLLEIEGILVNMRLLEMPAAIDRLAACNNASALAVLVDRAATRFRLSTRQDPVLLEVLGVQEVVELVVSRPVDVLLEFPSPADVG